MEIYTIGFTQKSAEQFFGLLKHHEIRRLLDIRLNNTSQLAGFTKRDDLAYFLRELCGAEYQHEPLLAPTQAILDDYKRAHGSWADYEASFTELLRERAVAERLSRDLFCERTVLLCSETTPERCHRRLVAEYLCSEWRDVTIVHL